MARNKCRTIVDLLDEDTIAKVSKKEIKDARRILEKELLERQDEEPIRKVKTAETHRHF